MENKKKHIKFLNKLPPMTKKKVEDNIKKNAIQEKEIKVETIKKTKKKKKKTCSFKGCKVKLKLTSLECKCKKKFCNKHFLAENHNCTFDYKKSSRENIIKNKNLDGCHNSKIIDKL